MSRLTLAQIKAQIDANVTSNANNENTGARVNALLNLMADNLYVTIDDSGDIITIPEWNNTTNYESGYVIYNGIVYLSLQPSGPENGGAVEPGTDANVWQAVESDQFAHPQNSDFRLGRLPGLIDATAAGGLTGTVDLTSSTYKNLNYFSLDTDAVGNDATYTLQTLNGTESKTGLILIVVPESAGFTVTFPDNTLQQAGGLELTGGDIALFEGNVNGKTKLLASNKQKLTASNLDTLASSSDDITPTVLDSGTGISVTDGDTTVNLANVIKTDTVDTTSGSTTVDIGGSLTFDEYRGYYIELQFTGGTEYYEITTSSTTGVLTVAPAISTTETGVTYRVLEKIYTDPNVFFDAESFLILTYNNRTDYAPIYKSLHRADSITIDGILTLALSEPVELTDSDVDWKIHDMTDVSFAGNWQTIRACNTTDDIIVKVDSIGVDDEDNRLVMYREGGNDPNSDYNVYIFLGDDVRGTSRLYLLNDYELTELRAHLSGGAHWDEFNRNGYCVCINFQIETADTSALTNTSPLPIAASAWDLNHPSRFKLQVVSDSIEITYDDSIARRIELVASVSIVRTGGSPDVTITVQEDTGIGWTDIQSKTVSLSNNSPTENVSFPIAKGWQQGDKLRFLSNTDGNGYYISELTVTTANANA